MVALYVRVFGGIVIGVLTAAQVVAQGDDTFCGATGAMIVSYDPIPEDIRNDAYTYAIGDAGATEVIKAHDLPNTAKSPDSEFHAVITAFGMAGVLSSAVEANRLLPGLDCSRFNVLSLD